MTIALTQGQWVAAVQPSVADYPRPRAILWLDSQVLVFGSWEEKRTWAQSQPWEGCLPSWVALARNKGRHTRSQTDRQTDTQPVFAPFGKEAPKMLHTHTHTAAPTVWCFYWRMVHRHRHTPYIQIPPCATAPHRSLSPQSS